jgi:SAM-dependent methyltransferase
MEDVGSHWEQVHATKADDEVSWFRTEPTSSLRLLEAWAPEKGALVDVGAGSSPFVDRLVDAGWHDLTVLDVSASALAKVRDRLAARAEAVTFVHADVRSWQPGRTFATWHDRAVFHFLVDAAHRSHYVGTAADATVPGGVVVLATFAADGPTTCSGLPTARYGADELAACFATAFDLVHTEREEHVTPFGTVQPFTWVVLRRR